MSPRWRKMLRDAAITFAAIFAVIVLIVFALVQLLRSDSGMQWLLQTAQKNLPELHIENARGNLIDGLQLQALRWETPDLELTLSDINARLFWPDLMRGFVTLTPFQIERLLIHPRGPDSNEPVVLPALIAPLILNVPRLQLAELTIQSGDTLTSLMNIDSSVRWIGADIRLRNTKLRYTDFDLAADGQLRFVGDYPLRISGKITSAQLPGPATVEAGGNLRVFKLKAVLAGEWPLAADGELRLLDDNLPLKLSARLAQRVQRDFGVDKFDIHSAELQAAGNLLRITGSAHSKFKDTRYGDNEFKGTWVWDGSALTANANLQLPDGAVRCECALSSVSPMHWGCRGTIDNLPLTPWLNGLQGQLSSPFTVSGRIENPLVLIDMPGINGQLNGVALRGNLQMDSPDFARWHVANATLEAGKNRIAANGTIGANSQLDVELNAPVLADVYGELSGNVRGKFTITGAIAQPSLRGELSAQDIRYDSTRLRTGTLQFDVRELAEKTSTLTTSLRGLQRGENSIDLNIALAGTRSQHHWQADVTRDEDRADMRCDGALTQGSRYRLDCPTLAGKFAVTAKKSIAWKNDAPLHAQWDGARNEGEIAALCLRSDPAALCVKPGLRLRQKKLQPFEATLTQLPLKWWRRALPQGLRLSNDARLNANVSFASQKPLRIDAKVQIDASEWRWRNPEGTQTFNLDPIIATANLDEERAQLDTALHSATIGGVKVALNVADPLGARKLDGRLAIEKLQLSAFGWAIPDAETLSGQIDGAVNFAGTLEQPLLQGELALANGTIGVGSNDPLEDLNAQLHFDNQRANLAGKFRLGEGNAQINGAMTWLDGYRNWQAEAQLHGDNLQFEPIADSSVQFAPALQLKATPTRLDLNGNIVVQKADIQLRQLPPETINPSRDAIISGREQTESGPALNTDINLDLGKHTHFAGFGADVDLTGDLHLHQDAGQELSATGRIDVAKGRYRAYGQRLIVRRGQFIFIGNLDNPDLNLEAIRELPPGNTDVVGLRITGSLRDPVAQLFSEQSLSESDIAYYLLTGRKRDTLQQGGQFSAGGTLLSLGLAGSEGTASKLAEKFGISGLQLGTAAADNGGTEAEVSGYLFRDLYVRYGRTLGEQINSVTLQYQLSPNLMIQTISGIEETLELIYTFTID